jgi:hydrogenase maturation protein HypF
LEYLVDPALHTDGYPFEIDRVEGGPWVVNWEPMIRGLLNDRAIGVSHAMIATRFHDALARIAVQMSQKVGEARVLLSGGCFQNRALSERVLRGLRTAGFEVYWHRRIPPNDNAIALGQLAAARWFERVVPPCV